MCNSVKVKCSAKINLSLKITGIRDDGYHLLSTVMQSVSIFDYVTVTLNNGGINISCTDQTIPCGEKNIAYKAAERYFKKLGIQDVGADIRIEKHIPQQAGMAGGSADAAGVLHGLNTIFNNRLSTAELCEIGEKIGADVPFCILGGTVLCEGMGEILTPLPDLPRFELVVAKPDYSVSTPEAYKRFDELSKKRITHSIPNMENILRSENPSDFYKYLYNDLEIACDENIISKIKDIFLKLGAIGTLMSGSGSAVYGIFKNEASAQRCYDELFGKYPYVQRCRPIRHGIEVIEN